MSDVQSRLVCLVGAALLLIAATAQAKHLHKEAEYRDAWCQGETEVRLPNGNRADCVTDKYAVEIDFAAKYHEAIGQALDYADQTGKRPAILLIVEKEKEWRYVKKARTIAKQHRIKVWTIRPPQKSIGHTKGRAKGYSVKTSIIPDSNRSLFESIPPHQI